MTVETRDISLAGRIIADFSDRLRPEQRIDDALAELGELAKTPEANIIKLPNISASIPQLKAAIAELQEQGYALPDYPDDPKTDEEQDVRARYDKVKGSAVNPVLREGNSDRRAPASVKSYARRRTRTRWAPGRRTRRPTSRTWTPTTSAPPRSPRSSRRTTRCASSWSATTAPPPCCASRCPVLAGEVVDATVMRVAALREFLTAQIARAKAEDVLFSVHLKATMMKVSDPIIFGHVVRAFFPKTVRRVRRRARRGRPQPRTTASAASSRASRSCRERRRRSRRPSSRSSPRARRSRWSTPTTASPTCTSPATSSSTPRCRR